MGPGFPGAAGRPQAADPAKFFLIGVPAARTIPDVGVLRALAFEFETGPGGPKPAIAGEDQLPSARHRPAGAERPDYGPRPDRGIKGGRRP